MKGDTKKRIIKDGAAEAEQEKNSDLPKMLTNTEGVIITYLWRTYLYSVFALSPFPSRKLSEDEDPFMSAPEGELPRESRWWFLLEPRTFISNPTMYGESKQSFAM